VGITSPVISAIQTTEQMRDASRQTQDSRLQVLAGATTALAAKNALVPNHSAWTLIDMQRQIEELLRSEGWEKKTWDGDVFFMKQAGGTLMRIIVVVKQLPKGYSVRVTGGIDRTDFQHVIQEIMADKHFYPVEYRDLGRKPAQAAADVMQLVAESARDLERQAKSFDFETKLQQLAASRPDSPSLPQIFHLVPSRIPGT
jgi:hypothetical protein